MSTASTLDSAPRKFGEVTGWEKFQIPLTLLTMPPILLWSVLTKPFVPTNHAKSFKRLLVDTALRVLLTSLNGAQLQYLTGSSSQAIYKKWTKANDLPRITEDIGEDAHLMWVGPKRTDKVILWLHGGAFLFPVSEHGISLWRYVQDQLKTRDQDVGLVILAYTLVPNGQFPLQLKQACKAVEHLLASGVKPENLQIVGDSAGGNLIIQLLSHLLHPLDDVPPLQLPGPIRGAYLMSPWSRIRTKVGNQFDGIDTLHSKHAGKWGQEVAAGVPESKMIYLEGANVPASWFQGISSVVSRVLITAGGVELLKNDIEEFNDLFSKHHERTEFVIQEGGVHDDPVNDFAFAGSNPKVGDLTPIIIDWLGDGFEE
ncbi:alpha/beta-hydrolase [Pluteus cervinus]|uniref:Alpha/beta-hydrolase n=1 Tax=Pluteus cervinus TaxID=181527 RepID=A0ACD3A166_9AGAR|nr:alpha/beta-hydrolase [Pluteus cervinus]